MRQLRLQSGFTLMELIAVIVLVGILAVGAGMLIANPIKAYDAQQRRQHLVDQAEMALRQLASDVRRALPNSLRVNASGALAGVEVVNTLEGARYRDQVDDAVVGSGALEVLDFSANDTDFNLLGSFSTLGAFAAGQRIVIYNTAPATLYQDARLGNNPGIVTPAGASLTLSTSVLYPNEQHVNIDLGGGAGFQFAQQSPGQRLFVIDGPVSYVCNTATRQMLRHSGYGYNDAQTLTPGGTTVTVATQVLGCGMTYDPGTSQRGGILSIDITLGDPAGEQVTLLHQVHVENVP